jgi:hypothetical protein
MLRGLRALAPRAFGAMAHVLAASRAERVEEGIEALSVAIEPTLALRASPELVARWLQHLPRDRAARVLAAWDEPVLPPLAYRLAPRVLEGAAARAFVERSLVHGRVYERYGDGYYRTELVAEVLGAVAAASDEETAPASSRCVRRAAARGSGRERRMARASPARARRHRRARAALGPRLGRGPPAGVRSRSSRSGVRPAGRARSRRGPASASACVIEPLDAPALAAALADRGPDRRGDRARERARAERCGRRVPGDRAADARREGATQAARGLQEGAQARPRERGPDAARAPARARDASPRRARGRARGARGAR